MEIFKSQYKQEFYLQYQSSGTGPQGIVILPPGKYILSGFRESSMQSEVWARIKQQMVQITYEISIEDLLRLQGYESYS
jgi:hypothetical protein